MDTTRILAFYAFHPLEHARVVELRSTLHEFGEEKDLRGLVLVATEGINGTVCGSMEMMEEWKRLIEEIFPNAMWNESSAAAHVFPRWLVKVREEIVACDRPRSTRLDGTHLTPTEWNRMMEDDDVAIVDARNTYETRIGMFRGAIDPHTKNFGEFEQFAKNCTIDKQKKVLLYCTGGIRCEKAVTTMKRAGFENVFQLEGGILSYLKQFPDGKFNGECFVFDHRVAVDQRLRPSTTYKLCPSCGDPGAVARNCEHCDAVFTMCRDCIRKSASITCSKNCRYHRSRAVSGDY